MKLPNRHKVIIQKSKLTDYLLSENHPLGKFKAKLFAGIGFNRSNTKLLEKTLRNIVISSEIADEIFSEYGTKYVIYGKIKSPNGKQVKLCTIWIIEKEQVRPRFITAYPV